MEETLHNFDTTSLEMYKGWIFPFHCKYGTEESNGLNNEMYIGSFSELLEQ